MNKIFNLHLEAIEKSKEGNYLKQYEESTLTSKSAEITEQIAIEFGDWLRTLRADIFYLFPTTKELFQQFLKEKNELHNN